MSAKDFNMTMISGRLGRDPELRHTKNGESVASFTIANTRAVPDRTTESGFRDETSWVNIVLWRDLAERFAKIYKSGDHAWFSGRLQVRDYTDEKTGAKGRIVEVVGNDYGLMEQKQKKQVAAAAEVASNGSSSSSFSNDSGDNGFEDEEDSDEESF